MKITDRNRSTPMGTMYLTVKSHWPGLVWLAATGIELVVPTPLVLTMSPNGHDAAAVRLGPNLAAGERPQVLVPAGHWQTAESLGEWTLVGCTVTPGFVFESFELAPPDWRPTPRSAGRAG